jgi:hypothetical protein
MTVEVSTAEEDRTRAEALVIAQSISKLPDLLLRCERLCQFWRDI